MEKRRITAAFVLFALAAASTLPHVKADSPNYSLTSLNPTINLGQTQQITLTIQNQLPNQSITFVANVTDPAGKQTWNLTRTVTNSTGAGSASLRYPDDFHYWPTMAKPKTNQTGTYLITAWVYSREDPSWKIAATSNFTVTSTLTLKILYEEGADFLPGDAFEISVATLGADTFPLIPNSLEGLIAGTGIYLNFTSITPGVYSAYHAVTAFIPQDSQLIISAVDSQGNIGQISMLISPSKTQILIGSLQITDQQGQPENRLTPDQTVYFAFPATYQNGTPVHSGRARVSIVDGTEATILPANYSPEATLFITTQGYQLPDSQGNLTISARVIVSDSAGSLGTTAPLTVDLTVAAPKNIVASRNDLSLLMVLPGIVVVGSGVSVYALRRSKRSISLREFRETLLQSKIRSTLFLSRRKARAENLLLGLLREDLDAGIPSIYLNFEVKTAQLMATMITAGVKVLDYMQRGLLRVADCSDLNKSLELTNLRLSIVTALENLPSENFSLYIDSLRLLFEDLPSDQVIAFLRQLSDELIKRHGTIYTSLRSSKTIQQRLPQIREVFDAFCEVNSEEKHSAQIKFRILALDGVVIKTPVGVLNIIDQNRAPCTSA